MNRTVSVATSFTLVPGARYRSDGDNSGEEFYEDILKPEFETALKNNEKLLIDLDGTYGYPPSFISEVFGRLYTEFGKEKIWDTIDIKTENNPALVKLIHLAIKDYK